MAIVYKAKCMLLNALSPLRYSASEFTDDEEFVKRFGWAQAAASLNHPNIVSIYDVGKQDDIQYIVMELIEGITLKNTSPSEHFRGRKPSASRSRYALPSSMPIRISSFTAI